MLLPPTAVPDHLVTPGFRLEPLADAFAELDHTAYVGSPVAITAHSAGRWPLEGFSLEEDRRLIADHEREHREGLAFAYAVLDPAGGRELGCLYLRPLADQLERIGASASVRESFPAPAAMVTFWLVDPPAPRPTAEQFLTAVLPWLRHDWPWGSWAFRCLPDEVETVQALTSSGQLAEGELARVGDGPPYRWFVPRAAHGAA